MELLVVIVIIAALAGVSAPVIMGQRKKADLTEATSNIKQIQLALFNFGEEYGSFPDNETAEDVRHATGTDLNFTGTSANDYFRQLIATGTKSERIFWCKTSYSPRKPDDVISSGKALEPGEVGYGYIMANENQGLSNSSNPSRPVVVSPLFKAQSNWEFDPEPYDAKAVVLRIDGSARSETIRTDNRFISVPGGFIQTNGADTVWEDITPVLRAPLTNAR